MTGSQKFHCARHGERLLGHGLCPPSTDPSALSPERGYTRIRPWGAGETRNSVDPTGPQGRLRTHRKFSLQREEDLERGAPQLPRGSWRASHPNMQLILGFCSPPANPPSMEQCCARDPRNLVLPRFPLHGGRGAWAEREEGLGGGGGRGAGRGVQAHGAWSWSSQSARHPNARGCTNLGEGKGGPVPVPHEGPD